MINQLLQSDEKLFILINNWSHKNVFIDWMLVFLGKYLIYTIPILLLIAWFIYKNDKDRTNMLKLVFSSVLIWQIPTRLIAKLWFRERPFSQLTEAKELVFHVPSYSFPSDHATFLAAFSMYLYLLGYKKIAKVSFVVTILVSISRVAIGLHYPGDILAGWALGILGAYLLYFVDKSIEKYVAKPLLKFAKKIKLA